MHRPPFLRQSRFRRVKAFLLLAVFLSAGTSLPSLDAAVYHHGAAAVARSQSHVEPAGGCLSHSDHCGLGRTASGSGAVATLEGVTRLESAPKPARQPVRRVQPACADRCAIPQPRAPPFFRSV
ncbi:MAG: hypothetical protein H0X07_09730 [Gemmatimonadales bacterium]|nr:hypothetical protein [Gemmatimonadales bacterium]